MKFTKLAVTKKEIFKVAHEITKSTIRKDDSYAVTFAAVLKEIYIAIKDLSSEYAAKAIKSRINCFFSQANTGFSFSFGAVEVNSEHATTINIMNEESIKNAFAKLSVSVINSIWDYMPFN